MTIQTPSKTGFEKWKDGINQAVGNAKWSFWDCEIQRAVNEYNRHLFGKAGYISLDWRVIKAMIWVESGANNSEWQFKPMQIGVAGDPGMTSFLSDKEGGDLIIPPVWKGRLTADSVRTTASHNIRAGIGYLLMRMANFEYRSVPGADSRVYEVTVKSGDSLDKIAKLHGTTIETLKKLNSVVSILRPGQKLKYKKSSVQRIITGWRQINTIRIAQRYNGGGDPNYAKKLGYALSLVRKEKDVLCSQ